QAVVPPTPEKTPSSIKSSFPRPKGLVGSMKGWSLEAAAGTAERGAGPYPPYTAGTITAGKNSSDTLPPIHGRSARVAKVATATAATAAAYARPRRLSRFTRPTLARLYTYRYRHRVPEEPIKIVRRNNQCRRQ